MSCPTSIPTAAELRERAAFYGLILEPVLTGPYYELSVPGDRRYISRGDLENTNEGIDWFIDQLSGSLCAQTLEVGLYDPVNEVVR